jgi:hypothetical protein
MNKMPADNSNSRSRSKGGLATTNNFDKAKLQSLGGGVGIFNHINGPTKKAKKVQKENQAGLVVTAP